jgi:hypothetical protein
MGGRREKVRGVYRFSTLVKQNKKAKICFVIHIAGERKSFFYIYAVIAKQCWRHVLTRVDLLLSLIYSGERYAPLYCFIRVRLIK